MRKTLLIVAVLLVFVFGIFGIPKGIGLSAWKTALTDRIHLGLDLKGGIHLVLQVMVNEAVSAETDNAVARDSDRSAAGRLPRPGVQTRSQAARAHRRFRERLRTNPVMCATCWIRATGLNTP